MAFTDEIRKTITSSTPFYAVAGATDLAAEKLRDLPGRLTKLREEAPGKLHSFREEELPRLREQAQHLAGQGVDAAKEYAVKARETYDELAARGRTAVVEWRGQDKPGAGPDGAGTPEVTVERMDTAAVTDAKNEAEDEAGAAGDRPAAGQS
ncbi:hypothetical protein [Streptomyces aidingensis]|uniref:Uncharacterized protein n=1 Tax=Streptomyces aidingensis TaxID=910347 RepID=A0A1I1HTK5_9ACTN|nr:hypothetical protein [Streptomyces aidingensis]SFC26912.1 hypothetical protein SAMN05421773_102506 [Streptomyces aidingensis]